MGNALNSTTQNKSRSKLMLWAKLVFCYICIMLMFIPATQAVFIGEITIGNEQRTITWAFDSDKLSRDGKEYTMNWFGDDEVIEFNTFAFEGAYTTTIDVTYNLSVALTGDVPNGVTASLSDNSGTIPAESTQVNTHSVTLSYDGQETLRDKSFDVTITLNTTCAVETTLTATYHVVVPGLVYYEVQDATNQSVANIQIKTYESSTGYINFEYTWDDDLVFPTYTGIANSALITGTNSMVLTLESNKTYTIELYKKNSSANYTSQDIGSSSWDAEARLVTFNANGDGNLSEPVITGLNPVHGAYVAGYTNGRIYGYLPSASRANYTFLGWYTAQEGGSVVTTDSTVNLANNSTILYAHWRINAFVVTFNGNGSSASSEWTLTNNLSVSNYFNNIANNSFVATTYMLPNYTLGEVSKVAVGPYTNIGQLITPVRVGYNFVGWFTESENGTQIAYSDICSYTEAVTFYAHWDPQVYSINYYHEGGNVFANNDAATGLHEAGYPTTHTYDTATVLKSATKTGYTFGGWFETIDCTGTAKSGIGAKEITNDINLYAKWTANTYNITYKDQGDLDYSGENIGELPSVYTYDEGIEELTDGTKTGYTFNGWFEDADCEGVAKTSIGEKEIGDITLYAKWTANTYTVTFNAGENGSVSPSTKEVTFDSAYGTLP
ncbi:MAG: InlB B-repeat-containing protein, partial [Clostridia bacterium]|nr:InlB B-repeat-containing protein [Clostridia bacterium]